MTVIEYLNKNGFNPLQDIEKNEGEDFVELHQIIENCIEAINKNSVIPDVIGAVEVATLTKEQVDAGLDVCKVCVFKGGCDAQRNAECHELLSTQYYR